MKILSKILSFLSGTNKEDVLLEITSDQRELINSHYPDNNAFLKYSTNNFVLPFNVHCTYCGLDLSFRNIDGILMVIVTVPLSHGFSHIDFVFNEFSRMVIEDLRK